MVFHKYLKYEGEKQDYLFWDFIQQKVKYNPIFNDFI